MKVIIEFIVIVIGIYLAFRLENTREENQLVKLEEKYIEQLLAEAKLNQVELQADQDARRVQVSYMRKLLDAQNRTVSADTLRTAINRLLMLRIYSPTDAVFQDLVSSGNLGIIKSDSVKQILMGYRQLLSRVPVTEGQDIRLVEEKIEPYLIRKQVLSLLNPFRGLDEIQTTNQQRDRIIRVLLDDREFIDLIYLRIEKIGNVIYFENPLQWSLNSLIQELEKELARFQD